MHESTNTALQGHLLVLVGIRYQLRTIGAPPQRLDEIASAIEAVRAEIESRRALTAAA